MSNHLYEGLTADLAAAARTRPPTHVFAVVTWGCAASQWLANVLNAHPEIFCVHALNEQWSRYCGGQMMDGPEYLRLLGLQANTLTAAGDVHGVSRHRIRRCREVFGDGFGCAVLVREPLQRLRSMLSMMANNAGFETWDLSYLDGIIGDRVTVPVDSYERRLFVHAVNMLNAVTEEAQIGRFYRTEDVTTDTGKLSELIIDITGGRVVPDGEWLRSCVGRPKVNAHATGSRTVLPFEPWQRQIIRDVVTARAWGLYDELGYPVPDGVL